MARPDSSLRLARPCGAWPSPVTPSLVAGKSLRLSELVTDGGDVLWLESRPAEAGRTVIVRWNPTTGIQDVTKAPLDVGTRVHEYGGGAYCAKDGRIALSVQTDGALWLIEPNQPVRQICGVRGLRFADMVFDREGRHLWAVREDHRAPGEPLATLVVMSLDPALDPATNEGTPVISGPDFLAAPRPSPAGDCLAWIEWDHPEMPWTRTRLKRGRIVRDKAGPLALCDIETLSDANASVIEPSWLDETLIAASDEGGWWNLYEFGDPAPIPLAPIDAEIGAPPWAFGQCSYRALADGSVLALAVSQGMTQVLHLTDGRYEKLQLGAPLSCPAPLPDGCFAWIDAPQGGPSAIVTGMPGAAAQLLRAAAPDELRAGDISHALSIHFPLREGGKGQAFFYEPANARYRIPDGEKPPLVVMAHGGPTGRSSDAFSFKIQWWTSRGFAVVDVNYGGSTGFGRRYRERLDGRWGEVDVSDCIDACEFLIRTGRVDPARIVIRGSSAGGMTVLLALAKSRIFAAGTSLYGVTDLRALAADTHKFESRYLDGLIAPWPSGEATFVARSPLTVANAIRCPVLFLHGTEDPVVPLAQARSMAAALRANGNVAEIHEFSGERHGFRTEATITRAFTLELDFYCRILGIAPVDQAAPPER